MKIDPNKKYTSGGHLVEHLHRAPGGWPGMYPWRGIVDGQEECWADNGEFYEMGNSLRDLTEVREPLRARVLVNHANKPVRTVEANEIAVNMHPAWRIIEMIEVMPANNPPTA
jgi:hypothetical protein